MKERLRHFLDALNFTPAERMVVLALAGAFLAGLAVRLIRTDASDVPQFDYSASDAEFALRSGRSPAGPSGATAGERTGIGPRGSGERAAKPVATNFPVDINRADKAALMALPGVGEVLAERILLHREERGGFREVRDLLGVKGIGRKILDRIAPYCTVAP